MKRRTKGILAFAFLGGIMVTSGVTIAVPGIIPDGSEAEFSDTGTPADNFPEEQRAQFCGPGTTNSTSYAKEFQIPTTCTQPLAITSDTDGNIWFAQANTGNIAKFDPVSEEFTEYENPFWPIGTRSMIWGIDYSPDNSLWYTDEVHDSIWRFSIDDETYQRFNYPSQGNSLPQRLTIDGSQIIINDLTGNKLTILDASAYMNNIPYVDIRSPMERSVTSGFARDANSDLWYTNWIPNLEGAVLVKLESERYLADLAGNTDEELPFLDYVDVFKLPEPAYTINGVTVDDFGTVWLADTSTSHFYGFDHQNQTFTRYVTSPVSDTIYGNHTGTIKFPPVSRPYWIGLDGQGRVIFNEQIANRIALFDPQTEKLIEYAIPSTNHQWSDCADIKECGTSQAFDFTVIDDKIWFTEWANNNIGVIDTSIKPTIDVSVDTDSILYEETSSVTMNITAALDSNITLISNSAAPGMIALAPDLSSIGFSDGLLDSVTYDITTHEEIPPGQYKVLVGVQTPEVTASEFFTLIVG